MDTLYRLAGALRRLDPALFARLQDEQRLTEYIADNLLQPEYVGRELLASKFDYLELVFEEEFEDEYYRFKDSGILHYELLNLVSVCTPVMEEMDFPASEDSRLLRYAVIAVIAEYLID
ncbi:MAG: hypothetical protein ACHQHN_04430 [Sphingobacteriales bacterium]